MSHTGTDGRPLPILVDPTGIPVSVAEEDERAPDTQLAPIRLEGWRVERWREHYARGVTPERLAAVHDQAEAGDPGPAEAMHEEMLEKDTRGQSLFGMRAAAAKAVKWEIVPARSNDPKAKKYRDWVVEEIGNTNFQQLLSDLLLAVPYGMAVSWTTWGLNDRKEQVPVRFERMRLERFMWHPRRNELRLRGDYRSDPEGLPIKAFQTVRGVFAPRGEHPSRAGLMRAISWLYMFKLYALQDYALFTERFGIPTRVVMVPEAHFLKTNLINRVREAVRYLTSDSSAVFPDTAKVIVENGVAGIPVHDGFLQYLDKSMAWGVVGHELIAQGSSGMDGKSFGVSAGKEVRADLTQVDCDEVRAEPVERDVFQPMVGYNFGWNERHLAPKLLFKWRPPKDQTAYRENVKVMGEVFGDQLGFSRADIRENLELPAPLDADETEEETDTMYAVPKAAPDPFGMDPDAEQEPEELGEREPPEEDEEEQEVGPRSLRRVAALAGKLRAVMAKMAPGQGAVDGLAEKGMAECLTELTAWPTPIRRLVTQAAREGWTEGKLRDEIAQSYLKLGSRRTERALTQRTALARGYGLSTRAR